MPRRIDEKALARAVRATGEPSSLVAVAIRAYLDGLEARELAKNPRIVKLASMQVGDRIYDYPFARDKRSTRATVPQVLAGVEKFCHYIQSHDKRRARLLMEEPSADWKPGLNADSRQYYVERVA